MRIQTGKRSKILLGITGGPGSGKTTIAEGFNSTGATIIDADQIGRRILDSDVDVRSAVKARFGSAIFDRNGFVIRERLASYIFNNNNELTIFNGIVHPHLIRAIHHQIDRFRLDDERHLGILDMALLFELWLHPYCDFTLFVKTPVKKRILWLNHDRGWSREAALQRMRSQMDDEEKERLSDIVLRNTGTVPALRRQALQWYHHYCESVTQIP